MPRRLPILAPLVILFSLAGCGTSEERVFRDTYAANCSTGLAQTGLFSEARAEAVCTCLAQKHISAVGTNPELAPELESQHTDECMAAHPADA